MEREKEKEACAKVRQGTREEVEKKVRQGMREVVEKKECAHAKKKEERNDVCVSVPEFISVARLVYLASHISTPFSSIFFKFSSEASSSVIRTSNVSTGQRLRMESMPILADGYSP